MERESWDSYFLRVAEVIASRSSCIKRRVGAVLVRDKHILSTGMNGPPKGAPHPTEATCVRINIPSGQQPETVCCVHAEINAIALGAYHGVCTKDSTLYVTTQPCAGCARVLINAGIVRVVFAEGYPDPETARVFAESQIQVDGPLAKQDTGAEHA